MSRGVLYAASGNWFVREAESSQRSLRAVEPEIETKLFHDEGNSSDAFGECIPFKDAKFDSEDKINAMLASPFEETLFLDTDTWVARGIAELFELLQRFDVAACHAPIREVPRFSSKRQGYFVDVPYVFPEFNTGVILLKKNARTAELLANWLEFFVRQRDAGFKAIADQPAFRKAAYYSDVRIATLPAEYNCRFVFPGYLASPVHILHGRGESYDVVANRLNSKTGPRVFLPGCKPRRASDWLPRAHRKLKSIWRRCL